MQQRYDLWFCMHSVWHYCKKSSFYPAQQTKRQKQGFSICSHGISPSWARSVCRHNQKIVLALNHKCKCSFEVENAVLHHWDCLETHFTGLSGKSQQWEQIEAPVTPLLQKPPWFRDGCFFWKSRYIMCQCPCQDDSNAGEQMNNIFSGPWESWT